MPDAPQPVVPAPDLSGREPQVRFILCADDYAQNSTISAGILDLAQAGRLSATSVMVTGAGWPGDAPGLAALSGRLAVGLHLNFTHGAPLGSMPGVAPQGRFPTLGKLIAAALLRRLDLAEIAAEVESQLQAFEAAMGFPPDHLDGHQHVHTLPGIRTAVLSVLMRRYPGRPLLLRDPSDRLAALRHRPSPVKAAIVAVLSAGFATSAQRAGYLTNAGFAGFSDFADLSYARQFDHFLRQPGAAPMIMCHPGLPGSQDDPIATRRPQELEALRQYDGLGRLIWHPARSAPGAPLDWPTGKAV